MDGGGDEGVVFSVELGVFGCCVIGLLIYCLLHFCLFLVGGRYIFLFNSWCFSVVVGCGCIVCWWCFWVMFGVCVG